MKAKSLTHLAVSVFCENMAMMTAAGIGAEEAVGLLCEDGSGAFTEAVELVRKGMEQGMALSEACAESGCFPAYACRMLAAGEAAGRLEEVLKGLADFYEKSARTSEKLRSAVVYPAGLLVLMSAILALLTVKVLPVFEQVYRAFTGNLAVTAGGYTRVAAFISGAALVITAALALCLLAGGVAARNEKGRQYLAGLARKCPFTAPAVRRMALARFTRVLSLFLASGLDVDSAIEAAIPLVDEPTVEAKAERCKARMAEGEGLAKALYEEKMLEPLYGRMLISGDRSGSLEPALARLAALFSDEAEQGIEELIDTIEPALSGFLTVAVGAALISVMLPLVGILGSIT